MPNVAGKKFPYTKKGMAAAEEAKKKMPKMMKGGKVKEMESMQGDGNVIGNTSGGSRGASQAGAFRGDGGSGPGKKVKDAAARKKEAVKKAMMPKMELPKRKKKAGGMGGEMGMGANAGMPKMKKGGKVRGYGKARGGKACKMR